MTAPCQQGNDTREHIAGTEFSLELSTNVVHGGVELCALTSSLGPRHGEVRRAYQMLNAVLAMTNMQVSCTSVTGITRRLQMELYRLAQRVQCRYTIIRVGVSRCDSRCYFNVHSKANMSPVNLPHGKQN